MVELAKAKEMMLTGAILNAQEALQTGLVNTVVEADVFEEEIRAFTGSYARGLGVALKEAKKLSNLGWYFLMASLQKLTPSATFTRLKISGRARPPS